MAWDAAEPQDTTKIRDLGTVIRPNWVAIEEADSTFKPDALNLDNRTVAGLPVNPTAIANAFIMYSKSDGAGNTQLYGIDPSSNVIQFTKGAVTNSSAGTSYLPGGVIVKWGSDAFGASASKAVTFGSAFPSSVYGVWCTPITSTNVSTNVIAVETVGVAGFTAYRTATSGVVSFYYLALGT